MIKTILPYNKDFPEHLNSYLEQITEAIKAKKHHDQRRYLFIDFLRKGFGVESDEVDLEKKIKVAMVRGRIDALFKTTIFEFKTDLERERPVAQIELKKYFESTPNPAEYLAIVTDGLCFEVYQFIEKKVSPVDTFVLQSEPLIAFRCIDQFLFSSNPVTPTSADIIRRFGLHSSVFNISNVLLQEVYREIRNDTALKVKFKEWNFLLARVYGTDLGDDSLFLRHTYLAIFSRLLVGRTLFHRAMKSKKDYKGLLTGEYFAKKNLLNLAEPDFFSWSIDTDQENNFIGFIAKLDTYLNVYNLSDVGEDILKGLYQELVDPESRHALGEYYTPDWLAELTLEAIDYKSGTLLDPACGSGTFLFKAIQRKRKAGLVGTELVDNVLNTITGLDVHPLAVMMSKANMLLALSNEIKEYSKQIYLPVYLADTLLSSESVTKKCITVPVSVKERFFIPIDTVKRKEDIDFLVDKMSEYAHIAAKEPKKAGYGYEGFAKTVLTDFPVDEKNFWRLNFSLLTKLINKKKNSIWPFILKNAYRPAFLRFEKVDYVVGNPPWLSYRYIKDKEYGDRVKQLTFGLSLLGKSDVKLFTQMDTSTVFFKYCQREFLKPGGIIAFVMPKTTILPAQQHQMFQQGEFTYIHDLSGVQPLFNVRSVVLVSRDGSHLHSNIPITFHKGTLPYKNIQLKDARKFMTFEEGRYTFLATEMKSAYYYERFFQGATLVPRCLWFVQPAKDSIRNLDAPFLETSEDAFAESKKPWNILCSGRIEKEFLFETVLAKGLLPFFIALRELVFLPIKFQDDSIVLLNTTQLLSEGKSHASQWLQNAENFWDKLSSGKRVLYKRLDYNKTLSGQNPAAKIVLLYNTSGSNLTAAILRPGKDIDGVKITGFVAGHKTYYYYPTSEEEGNYLCAMLNSDTVNQVIKPYQPQGLYGERDICRRPFEACPIRKFDPANEDHIRLAKLSCECTEILHKIGSKIIGRLGTARLAARKVIAPQLAEIDKIVQALFKKEDSLMPLRSKKIDSKNTPLLFDL